MNASPRKRVVVALALVMTLVSGGCSRVRDIVVVKAPRQRVSLKGYPLDLAYGEEPAPSDYDHGTDK